MRRLIENLILRNPVPRTDGKIWVSFFCLGGLSGFSIVIGCKAMIELMQHLCFVEWQKSGARLALEQVTVARHVEESLPEMDFPRVHPSRFVDQHWDMPVDLLGKRCVGASSENGAGPCIGIEKCKVFRCQFKLPQGVPNLLGT